MSDFDERMRAAWRAEQPQDDPAVLAARVRGHRRRHGLRRGVEIALTLIAAALLARPLFDDVSTPAYWLLMPFFAVYLPTAWFLLLRSPRPTSRSVTQDGDTYAHVRLAQLHAALRDLWLARLASKALLAYAVLAMVGVLLLGDAPWHAAAIRLLLVAGAWTAATYWISLRRRRRPLQEYRALRRLTGRR